MIKIVINPVKGGGEDWTLLCECGKPLILSNEWGTFCEDRCGEKKSKAAFKYIKRMFPTIFKDWA